MNNSKNHTINVYEKIPKEKRKDWRLYIDAIYRANPTSNDFSAEVLSKLFKVGNQGGFRFQGKKDSPKLVVLSITGKDIYWKDELNTKTGTLLYYGDNQTPGKDLHDTKLGGNKILRYIFELASSDNIEKRKKIPPVLVFKSSNGRDVKFLGLAVPGIIGRPQKEWLTAVWGCTKDGDRFQNYKSYFTILDVSTGSESEVNDGINLEWLNDIENGKTLESKHCPIEWKNYILKKKFQVLAASDEKFVKTKEKQLPSTETELKMLKELQAFL